MKHGFTIVELIVAMAIGVILAIVLWSVFWADQRRYLLDQDRIAGLRGAILFDDALSRDLHRLVLFLGTGRSPRFHVAHPVEISPDGSELSFLAAAPEAASGSDPFPTEVVRFGLDRGALRRITGTRSEEFPGVAVESLAFGLSRIRSNLTGLDVTSTPAYYPNEPHWLVKYQITSRLTEASPNAMPADGARITLVGSVPIRYARERVQHPYWMPGRGELPALPAGAP